MATTNFPDGVTNANIGSANGQMVFEDPTKFHTYFNDFDQYVAADWAVTETQAGATQALTAGDGGWLLLTNSATDDDLNQVQKTPASFAIAAAKKAYFACRFKASDVTQNDLMVGLVIVDTDPFATPPTDGIYFQSLDGVATVDVFCRKNATTGSTTKAAIATLVNDTFIVLSWYYDGAGTLAFGVNGNTVGYLNNVGAFLPDAGNLAPLLAIQAGEAGAETMTIDYVFTAVER